MTPALPAICSRQYPQDADAGCRRPAPRREALARPVLLPAAEDKSPVRRYQTTVELWPPLYPRPKYPVRPPSRIENSLTHHARSLRLWAYRLIPRCRSHKRGSRAAWYWMATLPAASRSRPSPRRAAPPRLRGRATDRSELPASQRETLWHRPACTPVAPPDSPDPAAGTPRPPSGSPADQPPSPVNAPRKARQPSPGQRQGRADSAPAGSSDTQAHHSSAADLHKPAQQLPVSAPPARQTARAGTCPADNPPPSRSMPPQADDAPHHSAAAVRQSANPDRRQSPPAAHPDDPPNARSSQHQTGPPHTRSMPADLHPPRSHTAPGRTSLSADRHPRGAVPNPAIAVAPAARSVRQTEPGIPVDATGPAPAEPPQPASQTADPGAHRPQATSPSPGPATPGREDPRPGPSAAPAC